jgi:hypothetical protein
MVEERRESNHMKENDKPKICCQDMSDNIGLVGWTTAGGWAGNDRDGWTMEFYGTGDAVFILVSFCPFCGHKLEAIDEKTSDESILQRNEQSPEMPANLEQS